MDSSFYDTPDTLRSITTLPVPVYQDETIEPLMTKGGMIIQKRKGYRFSVDAVLLASMAARFRCTPTDRYLDMGTGCGIIPVLLLRKYPYLHGYGIEIQQDLADMARRNMVIHGVEARVQILCMDLKDLPSLFAQGSFDWITTNPPYRKLASGRINPDPQKAAARHEIHASLPDIVRVAAHLLRDKGSFFVIYPAGRVTELIAHLTSVCLTPKRIRPVYPDPTHIARRVLIEASLKGKEDLTVERPLFLKDHNGLWTEEVQRIFEGMF